MGGVVAKGERHGYTMRVWLRTQVIVLNTTPPPHPISDPYVRVSLRRDKKIFSKTTKTKKKVGPMIIQFQ